MAGYRGGVPYSRSRTVVTGFRNYPAFASLLRLWFTLTLGNFVFRHTSAEGLKLHSCDASVQQSLQSCWF
jgi:hypothetical protein